jgi:hypothetical protein
VTPGKREEGNQLPQPFFSGCLVGTQQQRHRTLVLKSPPNCSLVLLFVLDSPTERDNLSTERTNPTMSTSTAIVPFVRRPRFVPEVGDGLGDRDGALNASGDSYCGSSWDVDGEPPHPALLCAP